MDYSIVNHDFAGLSLETPKPDKGVIEHSTVFPSEAGAFAGCQLVRLDKPDTGLQSWRMRIPSRLEVRITESPVRAVQATRARETMCHYVMLRGWGACLTQGTHISVSMAFAKHNNFVLSIPSKIPYVIVTSEGSAFSFQETTFTISAPEKDSFWKNVCGMSDQDIFKHFADSAKAPVYHIEEIAKASFV